MTKFFGGDENFIRRKILSKNVLASFDRFNTLQIWNIINGWLDGN